jgi:hypothetical protein
MRRRARPGDKAAETERLLFMDLEPIRAEHEAGRADNVSFGSWLEMMRCGLDCI